MARKARQPRKRTPAKLSRTDTQRLKRGSDSRRLLKQRIIALESRMVVLERLVWEHHAPLQLEMQDVHLDVKYEEE